MLQSYLNMLKVIQITNGGEEDLKFQIKIKAVNDEDVVQKVKDFVAIFFFNFLYILANAIAVFGSSGVLDFF